MPAAAAREPSAAWDPTDTRPCSSAGAAYARAVLRELPGSGDDLRSTHSVSLSPARTGGGLRLALILRRCADAKRAWPPCRIAGCQVRSVTQASLGAGTSAAALVIHRTSGAPVCPAIVCAASRILDRTPRPPERNSLPPACLRARALRWLFDHGNASNYLLVCCSIVMHPRYRSLMKIIQLRCEQY